MKLISKYKIKSGKLVKTYRVALGAGLCVLASGLFFSCTESDAPVATHPDTETSDTNTLAFYVNARSAFQTRAIANGVEDYEDDVNLSTLKVLFFDANGNFIFDATDSQKEEEIRIEGEETRTYVKVTVQIGNITDGAEGNQTSLAKQIHDLLCQNKFKIAVLANWPQTPSWTYANSVLNTDKSELKTIEDLHFMVASYDNTTQFDYVVESGKMPVYMSWIDADGTAVKPTLAQGIPMYGVQEFEPIGVWINGDTIVLDPKPANSDNGNSDDSNDGNRDIDGDITVKQVEAISLIRSVAKVEIYFNVKPATNNVSIINSNVKAYCEPVDVKTSTSVSWVKDHVNDNCEWFNIQEYGIWNGTDAASYSAWFKGLYGSWSDWKEGFTIPSSGSWVKSETNLYPRIYHPHVESGTTGKFMYAGVQNGWYKYVLYMPEKNIADPEGGSSDFTPKAAYIEYSYDDLKFHRIYFSNYNSEDNSVAWNEDLINVGKSGAKYASYKAYEADADNFKKHWPIMRNHVYRYMVSKRDENEQGEDIDLILNVRINPWGYNTEEEVW